MTDDTGPSDGGGPSSPMWESSACELRKRPRRPAIRRRCSRWRRSARAGGKSEQASDRSSISGPAETLAPARRPSGH